MVSFFQDMLGQYWHKAGESNQTIFDLVLDLLHEMEHRPNTAYVTKKPRLDSTKTFHKTKSIFFVSKTTTNKTKD